MGRKPSQRAAGGEAERGPQAAMDAAVRLLARREHTGGELRRKLAQRGFRGAVLTEVVAACRRRGYVDDGRAADIYVRERLRKGYGPLRIRQGLAEKGVAADIVAAVLSKRVTPEKELETARGALSGKRGTYEGDADHRRGRERAYRWLHSRGFSPSVAREALRMEWGER